MNWATPKLEEILDHIWQALANETSPTTFRTPVLGTTGPLGCALRTMRLRDTDPARRSLTCYADYRAPKIREIQAEPRVQWLFYDPAQLVQIRATGRAAVCRGDVVAREAWQRVPSEQRGHYRSALASGSWIREPRDAWAAPIHEPGLPQADQDAGWENFSVIQTVVEEFDWLLLREPGFRRARFRWTGQRFDASWLAP